MNKNQSKNNQRRLDTGRTTQKKNLRGYGVSRTLKKDGECLGVVRSKINGGWMIGIKNERVEFFCSDEMMRVRRWEKNLVGKQFRFKVVSNVGTVRTLERDVPTLNRKHAVPKWLKNKKIYLGRVSGKHKGRWRILLQQNRGKGRYPVLCLFLGNEARIEEVKGRRGCFYVYEIAGKRSKRPTVLARLEKWVES